MSKLREILERLDRQKAAKAKEGQNSGQVRDLNEWEKEFIRNSGASPRVQQYRADFYCALLAMATEKGIKVECSASRECPVNQGKWYADSEGTTNKEVTQGFDVQKAQNARKIAKRMRPTISIPNADSPREYDNVLSCQIGITNIRKK